MIVFDLCCGRSHIFEAWFGSTTDYEAQNRAGRIACPLCGDADITKSVMAPAVAAKGNRHGPARLLAAQRAMEADSTYVGGNFAVLARARHEDGADGPGIHGEATLAEAAALVKDGIAILPMLFRPLAQFDA